jgi:ammonium transporter
MKRFDAISGTPVAKSGGKSALEKADAPLRAIGKLVLVPGGLCLRENNGFGWVGLRPEVQLSRLWEDNKFMIRGFLSSRRWNLAAIAAVIVVALWSAPLGAQSALSAAGEKLTSEKASPGESTPPEPPKIDSGDTAWMITASALVMLMVPGLALFYGGMARSKNILATMMQSMAALAVVGVFWITLGYCLAFGSSYGGWIGFSRDLIALKGVKPDEVLPNGTIPIYVHVLFQGMFAILTPALISGAIAERVRFWPYCLFLVLWSIFVYCPLAHWVWGMNWFGPASGVRESGTEAVGWLGKMGALDFAGGTVVHIAAGFSGLAAALMIRRRIGYPKVAMHPSSMVLTLLGAGLLWFGWFGFNGGSGLASGSLAGSAFVATQAAAAAAGLSWMLVEWRHKGKATALGLSSGIVAGLVAVTPASGFVTPAGALVIGLLAGVVCYVTVALKPRLGYDDSLDAFGVHGVGGLLGAVLTGCFCTKLVNATVQNEGLFLGGGWTQVWIQLVAAAVAAAYAFLLTLVLVKIVNLWGLTTDPESEIAGLDRSEHGEVGFSLSTGLEELPLAGGKEPRPATQPPDGNQRFSVIVEGADPKRLAEAWSDLCQADSVPTPEFKHVYPAFTTMQHNRFRFRGGNPEAVRENLERLLRTKLGNDQLRVHLEHGPSSSAT